MLEVRELSVSYGQHRALDKASLRVAPGEIVVILGANGAGKSTLLKAVSGICEGRATGSVTLGGQELIGQKPNHIVEAGLALVPEGRGIFGDLTVQENLLLGAYCERARNDEASNLERVLSLFPKLAERRSQTVRTMSGGEQQMVAIGRAMMSNPEILALDEPSLGLSPLLCKDLFQSLLTVRKAGLGVLLVEQNAKQSLRIADRGYLLENGTIVHESSASAMMNDPAVQKAYLGAGGGSPAPHIVHRPIAAPDPAKVEPKRERGPSPAEIAAAVLQSVNTRPHTPPPPAPARAQPMNPGGQAPVTSPAMSTAPKRASAMPPPNVSDLVARASAKASRRQDQSTPVRPQQLPQRPAAPTMLDPGSSTDRLRTILEEIENAARRAETYRPGHDRR